VSQEVLRWIRGALIFPAALVGIASVIVYSRVQWWRSVMGRHIFTYMTLIAVVLTLSAIRLVTAHDSWWFTLLQVVAFAGVLLAMTHRLYLLIQAQREDDRAEKRLRPVPPPAPRKDTL